MAYSQDANPPWFWYDFTPDALVRGVCENFSSPDVFIWPEDSDGVPNWFSWASPHLNDAPDAEALAGRQAALKAVFDGAMLLVLGPKYVPITLRPAASDRDDPNGILRWHGGKGDVTRAPFSSAYLAQHADPLRNPLNNEITKLIFLARFDPLAKDMLLYVGVQGLTYISLYALTDWMTQRPGWHKNRVASEAGLSKSRYNDFTATANNPAYLGPFCRHGGIDTPPKRPMPYEDAEGPIRTAARAFLDELASDADLDEKWRLMSQPKPKSGTS